MVGESFEPGHYSIRHCFNNSLVVKVHNSPKLYFNIEQTFKFKRKQNKTPYNLKATTKKIPTLSSIFSSM